MTKITNSYFLVLALAVAACGKPSTESTPTGVAPASSSAAPEASVAPAEEPPVELIVHVNNEMKFDRTVLMVKTGTKVHLTVKSSANMPTMPHNWVLLKTAGTEAEVALDGYNTAPDAGFVNPASDKVLAFTPLAGPGGRSEVTFTAPAPGKYPFICTVPGHYLTMKGELTVTP